MSRCFGNLFETERCEGDRDSSKDHETFSVPSGDIAHDCLNVEHAGMIFFFFFFFCWHDFNKGNYSWGQLAKSW